MGRCLGVWDVWVDGAPSCTQSKYDGGVAGGNRSIAIYIPKPRVILSLAVALRYSSRKALDCRVGGVAEVRTIVGERGEGGGGGRRGSANSWSGMVVRSDSQALESRRAGGLTGSGAANCNYGAPYARRKRRVRRVQVVMTDRFGQGDGQSLLLKRPAVVAWRVGGLRTGGVEVAALGQVARVELTSPAVQPMPATVLAAATDTHCSAVTPESSVMATQGLASSFRSFRFRRQYDRPPVPTARPTRCNLVLLSSPGASRSCSQYPPLLLFTVRSSKPILPDPRAY